MFPLRDLNPTYRRPTLLLVILGINVVVYLVTMGDLDAAAREFGAVAYHFTGVEPAQVRTPYGVYSPVPVNDWWWTRAVTHMFVHGSFLHLAGNMWFLWIFGDNVEDRYGHLRFLLIYFASGAVALTAQVLADPSAPFPMVGASGAIGGVLGAYLRLFPHARVLTLVFLGFFITTMVWPAWVFLLIWFGIQLFSGFSAAAADTGVAFWAHVGGFVAGFLLAVVLPHEERPRQVIELRRRPSSGPWRL